MKTIWNMELNTVITNYAIPVSMNFICPTRDSIKTLKISGYYLQCLLYCFYATNTRKAWIQKKKIHIKFLLFLHY